MNHPNYEAILKWYRGKALAQVRDEAIPLLRQSVEQSYWLPKASRRVRSLLKKTSQVSCALAMVDAKEFDIAGGSTLSYGTVYDVRFGCIYTAPRHLEEIRKRCAAACGPAVSDGPESFLQWCLDFAPIADLISELDAARPKPMYVMGTISRTVMNNVGKDMGLSLASVRQPEIVWEQTFTTIKGQRVMVWVPRIIWPDGTVHNASRFAHGSKAGNDQCHACGHAIRNAFNWVPLVADAMTVVDQASPGLVAMPCSLWVGRDCAKNLFGVVITGEAKFQKPAAPQR